MALAMAYGSEHIYGLLPCVLCIYQRIPYFMVIILAVIANFTNHIIASLLIILCGLTLLIGAGIAAYHVGVEHGKFQMTEGCTDTSPDNVTTIEQLRNTIVGTPAAPCDKPALMFIGLSMAGWNAILSIFFGSLSTMIGIESIRRKD